MEQAPHLTWDEIDQWLETKLAPARTSHLETCSECRDAAHDEQELVLQLRSLPLLSPTPGFSARVLNALAATNPILAPALRHIGPDEMDAWLEGTLAGDRLAHLEACGDCRSFAEAERELVLQLRAVPLFQPAMGFADRVLASVRTPAPAWARWGTRSSVALAAGVGALVVGSMAGSVIWSLSNQQTISAIGSWLGQQAYQWLWVGLQGTVSNLIEQPWYDAARRFAASPSRLALLSATISALYVTSAVAFRRLLTLPSPQVQRAGA